MEKRTFEAPPRILVADDDRDVADVYAFLLSAAGYRVQRAYDGLTALSLAKVVKPDAAILDFQMPGLSGLQVLSELRESGVATRVIIASGVMDFADLSRRAAAAGAEACVQKPCPASGLLSAVARALGDPRPNRQGFAR